MIRCINKRLGLWMLFFFVALLGCIPLLHYIERHEQEYPWITAAVSIGCLVFLFGNLGLMVWFSSRQQRRFGHRCPSCNKALIGFSVQLAIATGNCGYCGEKVFSDQEV